MPLTDTKCRNAKGQITGSISAIPCSQEGRVANVTKRWARGAMGASCHKTSDVARTAKSCGPDAPTLASSS